jgi:DNA helicase-2/ATP-dependent DNA helicase PcrA
MSELNPHQLQAVQHLEGPLLVLAGAGSGKTRVITHRIAHLLDIGVSATEILAVTFTNKAAEEMKTRIRALKQASVLACTFHSLGARILRESIGPLGYTNDFTIYDQDDSEKLLKTCLEELGIKEQKGQLKELKQEISRAKNNLEPPLKGPYLAYQEKLKSCNALDFDDLLYLPALLFQQHPDIASFYQKRWLFLLIDEYQDTNLAQYTLAKTLVASHGNLFAVGDPDQSIYSWRGACYQNILNFETDFPGAKVITLDQNYRSTNTILQAANSLIEHNTSRYKKTLWSALGEGEKIGTYLAHNERKEAEFVAEKIGRHRLSIPYFEMGVFYRTNAQSRALEDALLARKIPYTIVGGLSFYQRKEIKDILSFLKMILSNTDLISFLRTIQLPRRGLGETTLDKIIQAANDRQMPLFSFLEHLIDFGPIKLSVKQLEGLKSYVSLIRRLRAKRPELSLHELLIETIEATGYLQILDEDPESKQERKENLDELIGKAAEWEQERQGGLPAFLEELSLKTSAEESPDTPTIRLMTVHNSKGLEFELVFLVGLEEELFPHTNSVGQDELIEEERRLCYVAMTRAKKHLYLTLTISRFLWGSTQPRRPSRFLKEIDPSYLKSLSPILFEPSFDTNEPQGFSIGEKVFHREFGVGIIRKAYNGSLGQTYDVYFPDSELERTLVAKYARLQPYFN